MFCRSDKQGYFWKILMKNKIDEFEGSIHTRNNNMSEDWI